MSKPRKPRTDWKKRCAEAEALLELKRQQWNYSCRLLMEAATRQERLEAEVKVLEERLARPKLVVRIKTWYRSLFAPCGF